MIYFFSGSRKDNTVSIKEKLVQIIQSAGYDMLTACELADKYLQEIKADKRRKIVYYIGNRKIIINKKG